VSEKLHARTRNAESKSVRCTSFVCTTFSLSGATT